MSKVIFSDHVLAYKAIPSHCHVKSGTFDTEAKILLTALGSHNFVNQLDVLVPKNALAPATIEELLTQKGSGCVVESNLQGILQFLISLEESSSQENIISTLKLISLDTDVTHQNSISIVHSALHLRLCWPSYEASGFKGALSQMSKGNRDVRGQMYDVSIDISKGLKRLAEEDSDKNSTRLFYFADKEKAKVARYFVASDKLDGKQLQVLLEPTVNSCTVKESSMKKMELGPCKLPDLEIAGKSPNDDDWQESVLEWITYASIGGEQLFPFNKTDSYLSNYSALLESRAQENLVRISLSGILISTEITVRTIQTLTQASWFAVLLHGVKDCNISYGTSTAHSFVEDGANDAVLLGEKNRFVIWEVVDSSDSHN
ncbi:hypothetical protein FOA43_004648 [Brettanomyces nanus]|uniref:Uncharacterized protein n=1 Tax=Eeniella nana TaxID=13502 RepID=A0A875S6N2_EENNA|nr:uncharacterized protein FOA43_004648 [Brettanomyces nanus]QPG77241.1 hypothetical protein FOA43_004648 [Brettanomyces nanus]